jgi:hypothetical protein
MRLSFRIFSLTLIMLAFSSFASAQWTPEWTGNSLPSGVLGGWLQLQPSGGNGAYRFYTLDTLAFRIMDGPYSQTPQYTYTFSAAERLAGEVLYSLGLDLTGDGITEFYVVSAVGTASPYRQSIKVFDITNNQTVFQRDVTSYSYTDASVWDVNGDGTLDGVFTRYDYPALSTYSYEVYNTGVAASVTERPRIPQQLNLRQNYPNPFNPSTRIDYELRAPGRVELNIMNVLGQRVRTLVDAGQNAGSYSVSWDGTDGNGSKQASGPYYYQIRVNGQPQETRQMILLK